MIQTGGIIVLKCKVLVLFVFFAVALSTNLAISSFQRSKVEDIKKSVIYIGVVNQIGQQKVMKYIGTGVLVRIHGNNYVVTAKHVVKPKGEEIQNVFVIVNTLEGKVSPVIPIPIDSLRKYLEANWIYHKNDKVDIAIIPFIQESTEIKLPEPVKLFLIDEKNFTKTDSFTELYDVFFFGYQPETRFDERIRPIFRTGTISLINNNDSSFFIDATCFPGNSGSPVFLKSSPIVFGEESITFGISSIIGQFIGIVQGYVQYEEQVKNLQTGEIRTEHKENIGLTLVWSVNALKEIIDSEEFKEQEEKIERIKYNKKNDN